MSIGFEIIEDATAIMRKRGVFTQVLVYKRNGNVYAKQGSGFVRLKLSGGTSDPNSTWDEIEGVGKVKKDICSGKWMEEK